MNTQPSITLEDDDTVTAIISLGSNLHSAAGSPAQCLLAAWKLLQQMSVRPGMLSGLYETEPVDCAPGTPSFVNAIAIIFLPRSLAASALLDKLLGMESQFGRAPATGRNLARVLDLDLICFGKQRSGTGRLRLPHPRAARRRFVLEPLAALAPQLCLPGQDMTVSELCRQAPAGQRVRLLD